MQGSFLVADGRGCICAAYSSHECACDADWTPQEVYDLRKKIKELEARNRELEVEIERLKNTIKEGL